MRIAPLGIALLLALNAIGDDDLRTVAERTDFRQTARHADVVELGRKLAKASPRVNLAELGVSTEGRSIPLWIVADPPVKTPEEAKASGKLVVFIIANIHAGEVEGKEALPMLVREMATTPDHPLLKDVILLAAPIYNCDGNEKFSKTNRPGQVGPDEMGIRANGQGLDLNRDFVKLEAPETRGFVRVMNRWEPHLFFDLHTTNGSHHRYIITYQGSKNPACNPEMLAFVRDRLMPEAGKILEAKTGFKTFFYGNFDRAHERWTTYGASPRFGTTYVGLRSRMAVLSEAYSYADFKTRAIGTLEFTRGLLDYSAKNKAEALRILDAAKAGGKIGDEVAIRSEARPAKEPVTVLGYVEDVQDGRPHATGEPKDYRVILEEEFAPTATVKRPYGYVVPSKYAAAIETLKRHGLAMEELKEDLVLGAEAYEIEAIEKAARKFEGHFTVDLKIRAKAATKRVMAGSVIVHAEGPLGVLAVYLLEPHSDDGLATWNFFDEGLEVGKEFPVLRLSKKPEALTGPVSPLTADAKPRRPITFDTRPAGGGGGRRGMGGGSGVMGWIDDDHFLQTRAGRLMKVEAETGMSEPFGDVPAMTRALAKLPGIGQDASNLARRAFASMNPGKTAAVIEQGRDLYYATFDGTTAVRLTNTPDSDEEIPTFSPDGRWVAFVRDDDLWVVGVGEARERRLTSGGSETLRHGKADWIYYEEIFNRNWKAFWWSPDSSRIAFFETDDAPVTSHAVLKDAGDEREVELTPYPRPGKPNPRVRLGIVGVAGGLPAWIGPPGYPSEDSIISDVGWLDAANAYCYVQNRTQTWLDVVKVAADGHDVRRLFRETTGAWVEGLGEIRPMKDGSFLLLSERDGYKHLYHYAADGSSSRQMTKGEWEISALLRVDEPAGYAYFTAAKDNAIGRDLYRVRISDGSIERLTRAHGTHATSLSPGGKYYVDSWSNASTPPRSALHTSDGAMVRTLDSGPLPMQDEYAFGSRELVKIPARDGFPLEGELILPPGMDPSSIEPHPVWFTTYAGPHTPTVGDAWNGGRIWDQALAAEGFVVFRVDPRGASGKGAISAWTAYKKLGVQELEDIKDAIAWLKKKPYVDGSRIGIGGHSYGGFMTSFAMTHCDLFAAGIAGAPVTDWRDYDSIYTERYMLTPRENPRGYADTSVVASASKLHGRLLIAHGAMDDNVSLRNTLHFVQALQLANKDFEMMIYPSSRHGIASPHYQRLQVEFIRRTLGEKNPKQGFSASPP